MLNFNQLVLLYDVISVLGLERYNLFFHSPQKIVAGIPWHGYKYTCDILNEVLLANSPIPVYSLYDVVTVLMCNRIFLLPFRECLQGRSFAHISHIYIYMHMHVHADTILRFYQAGSAIFGGAPVICVVISYICGECC